MIAYLEPPARAIEVARAAASRSPCVKSKRGAVLFWSDSRDVIVREITAAFNGPPLPWRCDQSEDCRAQCGATCMHAESRCLATALRTGIHRMPELVTPFRDQMLCHASNYDMLHVKVVGGKVVAGGPPSCLECSKQILEAGIRAMWLYEAVHVDASTMELVGGVWRYYSAQEFHAETLRNKGLRSAAERWAR